MFVKLSELQQFTVKEYKGFKWKLWDNQNKKMLTSDTYQQGYRKTHQLEVDKGTLDVSSSQIGSMLESCLQNGQSNILNKTFNVKTNGKQGLEIRYYINLVRENAVQGNTVASTATIQQDHNEPPLPSSPF